MCRLLVGAKGKNIYIHDILNVCVEIFMIPHVDEIGCNTNGQLFGKFQAG